jgi:hypothetical protein
MSDGQGKDRRSGAGKLPDHREVPAPQPYRSPAYHLWAGCLPRVRAWPTILSVRLVSSLASNPSAAAVRAMRLRSISPRAPGRSGRPRSRGPPLWVHQQRVSRLYVSPAAGAAASLRHWPVRCDGTQPAAQQRLRRGLRPPGRMRQQACACRVIAAKMVLPVTCLDGCPRAGERRLCHHRRRDLAWPSIRQRSAVSSTVRPQRSRATVALVPGCAPMTAPSQAAIISASSATSRALRRAISWSSTCRLSHGGGGDTDPPPGERLGHDGVLPIDRASPGHAEAGASLDQAASRSA